MGDLYAFMEHGFYIRRKQGEEKGLRAKGWQARGKVFGLYLQHNIVHDKKITQKAPQEGGVQTAESLPLTSRPRTNWKKGADGKRKQVSGDKCRVQ